MADKYVYIAAMDVDPDKEADFNDCYDNEHVPGLLQVPGVLSATRYQALEGSPKYPRRLRDRERGRRDE